MLFRSNTTAAGSATTAATETSGGASASTPASVSLPSATLRELASSNPEVVLLEVADAIASAHGQSLLSDGQFTIFVPNADAVGLALSPLLTGGGLPQTPQEVLTLVQMHIVAGVYRSADVAALAGSALTSVSGESLAVAVDGATLSVNGANVLTADLEFAQGVVHVVDTMFVPAGLGAAGSEIGRAHV